jgi:hypothetical protein
MAMSVEWSAAGDLADKVQPGHHQRAALSGLSGVYQKFGSLVVVTLTHPILAWIFADPIRDGAARLGIDKIANMTSSGSPLGPIRGRYS